VIKIAQITKLKCPKCGVKYIEADGRSCGCKLTKAEEKKMTEQNIVDPISNGSERVQVAQVQTAKA